MPICTHCYPRRSAGGGTAEGRKPALVEPEFYQYQSVPADSAKAARIPTAIAALIRRDFQVI